jgi:hypothetical protein
MLHESLRIRRKILGTNHRDVAILWYNIATIFLEIGEDDEAMNCYKETLCVERHALEPGHHDVVLSTRLFLNTSGRPLRLSEKRTEMFMLLLPRC